MSLIDQIKRAGDEKTPATPEKKRAVIYARVSTKGQEVRGLSIKQQVHENLEFADAEGYEVDQVYRESGSASDEGAKRPQFDEMVRYIQAHPEISAIIVNEDSRFTRRDGTEAIERQLEKRGVRLLYSHGLNLDPTSLQGVVGKEALRLINRVNGKIIAMHVAKGCKANIHERDPETGYCFKNGCQPLFGYKRIKVPRGMDRGEPIYKTLWVFDDEVINGRPIHDWVREALLMATDGASLKRLSRFFNENGLKPRRRRAWGHSTWNAMLTKPSIYQYGGIGLWNVRDGAKANKIRPVSEWEIEANAHPAILTDEEATALLAARESAKSRAFVGAGTRAWRSPYLLSGGIFKCGRCGSNMTGYPQVDRVYYVCGSMPHRGGADCRPAVLVRKEQVEGEVIAGLATILEAWLDPKGVTRQVNAELARLWEAERGAGPEAGEERLAELDSALASFRKSLEVGSADVEWLTGRISELVKERAAMTARRSVPEAPPKINFEQVRARVRELNKSLECADIEERKRLIRMMISEIKLAPDSREVLITYRVPEAVMECVVAGVRLEALETTEIRLKFMLNGRVLSISGAEHHEMN